MAEQSVTYAPTEEHDLIRSTARQFLADRLEMSRVRELMMSEDGFDMGLWKEMADLGWMGLGIAEEHGGAGLGPVEVGVLVEEMGRAVVPGPFFASALLATTAMQEIASEDQQSEYLPGFASGETVASLAVFESARGWGAAPETRAIRSGDDWIVTGSKRSVLDAHLANLLLVVALVDDGVGLFAVDPSHVSVSIDQESVLDPTRRQAAVGFDGAAATRIGDGDARGALERVLQMGTVALAAEQLGGAQKCMEDSVEYAKTRHQFGRPIGSYQAIKHRCANMLMKIEHAKSAVYYAARVTDDQEELAIAAPLAGSLASETYTWVAGENIQVHGGIGFTWEHDAHVYLKRAKASSLLLGSPRHQRDLMGRALGL